MSGNLRFDIADQRLTYTGQQDELPFENDRILEFNHRHKAVLHNYDLSLESCKIVTLSDKINPHSNLGALRNRQLRQAVILSAGLSAAAVALYGRGSLTRFPKEKQTTDLANSLKRANDRTSAQVMADVLQTTTETLPMGEEVIIESAITEGVRVKPGKEAGGNPTIAVGAVFGKDRHQADYGLTTSHNVTQLSMGNDVIDGTTKSVKGLHSSLTALFVTESGVKRHLPDIYVQRWMSAANFEKFNPRSTSVLEIAEIIANSYGFTGIDKMSTFFLDRPRHEPAMDILNKAGVSTPFDKDGDLMPAIVLGMKGLSFPDGRGLHSMIGEIGGSAEWAVGVLPLVWRGGQAIGMLTSQSSLTRTDLDPGAKWRERFHFTEEEFMLIQDARFERKPYFTISDILENPYAGGVSAFGAITDNYYIPFMKGVEADKETARFRVSVLAVNSLGVVECWQLGFKCNTSFDKTYQMLMSPKDELEKLSGTELEKAISRMMENNRETRRYRIFFNSEYYPALIPVQHKMVVLHKAIDTLIERGALNEKDREIIKATEKIAGDWFINSD